MIDTKLELKKVIKIEQSKYSIYSPIRKYLKELRICEYYKNVNGGINRVLFMLHDCYRKMLGLILGFEIPLNVFDKGLHIIHAGNIIVNENSHVGEYCTIIGTTCLGSKNGGNGPILGNHCELGMNSIVIGEIKLGNSVFVGAGAVVTKSFGDEISLAGVPAKVVR